MKQFPDNIAQLLNSPEAQKLLQNKDALTALSQSAEVQTFLQMLSQKSGGNLQAVAQAAMKGDPSQLSRLVNEVTQNPEAAKAVANLNGKLPK